MNVDGNVVVPTAVAVSGATVALSLASPVTQGQVVSLSYNAAAETTVTATDAAIQDLKGNNSSNFTGLKPVNGSTVIPDTTAPVFVVADAQVDATGTKVTLPFDETLTALAKPAASAFKISVDGKISSPASVAIDGKNVVLTLNKAIIAGAATSVEYIAPVNAAVKTNPAIQDFAGNDTAAIAAGTVIVNNSAVDGTAPKLVSAGVSADGKSVSLTFGETLAAKTAALTSFEVKVEGVSVQPTAITVVEDTLTLSLPRVVTQAEKVSVTYTAADVDPTAANSAIQDTVGNDVASFVAATDSATYPISASQVESAIVLEAGAKSTPGSDNDNVFSGVVSATPTLDSSDTIDGGAGDNVLNVTLNGNFAGFVATSIVPAGSMQNVQTVNLSSTVASSGYEFNATGIKGVTKYGIDAVNGAIALKEVAALAQVDLYNQKTGDLSVGYSSTATTSPALATNTSDNQRVTVTNVGKDAAINAKITGVETLTLTSAGTENKINLDGVSSATTINLAGTAPITIGKVPTSLTAFDANAAKGAVTADLTNAATQLATVTGGAANDTFTVDLKNLSSTAAISGGLGSDTLIIKSTKTTPTSLSVSLNGVETLNVDTLVADQQLTFGVNSATSDALLKNLIVGSALAANLNVTTKTTDLAITAKGTGDSARTITVDNGGSATTPATATVTYADATAEAINAANYKFYSATKLNVEVGKNVVSKGVFTALAATDLDLKATNGSFVDASVSASLATGKAVITTGTTASTLTLNAQQLGSLEATAAGNLTLNASNAASTVTSNLSGLKKLTITQSSGIFDSTAVPLKAVETLNISGTNGQVKLGVLGGTTATGAVALTADGLFGGLSATSITTSSGNITVDILNTKGSVDIGAITSTAGNVTISAGTKSIGTIKLGAMTGKEVSVDVGSAAETITLDNTTAAITALTKATFTGSRIQQNNITIVGGTGSTDLLASVTGGNENDSITINSSATQAVLTVTGDGKLGTNHLTINASSGVGTKIDASGVTGFSTTVTGGANADTITGSASADTITGAGGNDVFNFGTNGSVAGTSLDVVTDYVSAADSIKFGASATLGAFDFVTATATSDVRVDAVGLATFNASDDTYAKKVTAIQADAGLDAAGSVAVFTDGSDSYIYYAGAATGNADDQIIKLSSVTATGLTLTSGAITSVANTSGAITNLTTAQVAAMTTAQIAALPTADFTALTTTQIGAVTTAQAAAFTSTHAAVLTTAQVAAIETVDVAALSTIALVNLTTANAPAITAAQAGALTTAQVAVIETADFAVLGTAAITGLTTANASAITASQAAVLTTAQVAAIETADFAVLSTAAIAGLTTANASAITSAQAGALTTAQVAAIETADFAVLGTAAIAGLTTANASAITASQAAILTTAQVAAIEAADFAVLSTAAIAGLTTANASAVTSAQVGALTTAQIAAFESADLAVLGTAAISSLSTANIVALTTANVPGITSAQAAVLTASQVAAFETADFAVLGTAAIAGLTTTNASGITATQAAALTTAQVANIETADLEKFSTAAIAGLTTADIVALTTGQTSILTTAQVPALTTAQIVALETADFANFTSTQIGVLTTAQVAAIEIADIVALTTTNVAGFTTANVLGLTTAQVAAFETADLVKLATGTVEALTNTQIGALTAGELTAVTGAGWTKITTSGSSSIKTGAVTGTPSADTIVAGATANITGGDGADSITLPSGSVNKVIYTAITNGADTVSNFVPASDVIEIGGALKTALSGDTTEVDGNLTPAAYAIETAYAGVVVAAQNGTLSVGDLTTSGYASVATSITNAFTFTDGAADATANVEIFAVESDTSGTWGLYAWTQSANNDTTVAGSELTLLGVFTGGTPTTTEMTIAA